MRTCNCGQPIKAPRKYCSRQCRSKTYRQTARDRQRAQAIVDQRTTIIQVEPAEERFSLAQRIGAMGVHLVCYDLLHQGVDAFLGPEGASFDVVAQHHNTLLRIQVKTTGQPSTYAHSKECYRFGIRRGSGIHGTKRYRSACTDIFAFVALDIKAIAYVSASELTNADGSLKQLFDLRSSSVSGRSYRNGTIRTLDWHRTFDNFAKFEEAINPPATRAALFAPMTRRAYGTAVVTCGHSDRPHQAHGLCASCYVKNRRTKKAQQTQDTEPLWN